MSGNGTYKVVVFQRSRESIGRGNDRFSHHGLEAGQSTPCLKANFLNEGLAPKGLKGLTDEDLWRTPRQT